MENWFLLYTKPKCEDAVTGRLSTAGFATLNPKVRERKLHRMRISEVTGPLFPCYVFARFDKLRDYHLIRYTRGVKTVLGGENGPAEIDALVVEAIEARMISGFVTITPAFTPGQTVIIKGGPFEGLSAVFEREMSGAERVSILIRTVGVRLVVDRGMIAAC